MTFVDHEHTLLEVVIGCGVNDTWGGSFQWTGSFFWLHCVPAYLMYAVARLSTRMND